MTEYAYRTLSTQITLTPAVAPGPPVVSVYRLPTMMPGVFHLTATQIEAPPSPPGGPSPSPVPDGLAGHGASPGPGVPLEGAAPASTAHISAAPAPASISGLAAPISGEMTLGVPTDPVSPPPAPPTTQPGDLVIALYHEDVLVATGANALPLQPTVSEGDDTWTVQLSLAPGTPLGVDYRFTISLNPYPSALPLLTRRIPLAFIQQGFDDNWNDRNYVYLEFVDGAFVLSFDPELASYHNLTNYQYPIAPMTGVQFPNIQLKTSHLSINSSADGFGPYAGPMTVITFSTTFTGSNGQPIHASIATSDVYINDFTITANFFLTPTLTYVGYTSQVTSDIAAQMYDTLSITADLIMNGIHTPVYSHDGVNDYLAKAELFLNDAAIQFGAAITPWLLGAAFDVEAVDYSPDNSQPVPATTPQGQPVPQGDIVVQYVGQAVEAAPGAMLVAPATAAALAVTTANIADGVVGQAYSQALAAGAGSGALSWALTGQLPPGLAFAEGTLSGTPTTAGVYSVTVTVHDAAGAEASRSYAFAVNPVGFAISTPTPLPDAEVGDAYGYQLSTLPSASAMWSASGLPPGLSMSPSGVISGTPSGNGTLATVAVHAAQPTGMTAFKAFPLTVRNPLLFSDPLYTPRGDGDTMWQPPSSVRALPGLPVKPTPATTPGNLSKIDHIVVVMMENRSFDHMLGYLSREGGRADIEGLLWEAGDTRTQANFYDGRYYYPVPLTDTQAFSTEAMSPDHSHEGVKAQMADGMGHFVSDYAKRKVGDMPDTLQLVMGYYGAQELPVYDMLAREFAVCDHWFCSHVGPTWPNRFVTLTGDLNRDSYGEPEVDTPDTSDFTPAETTTIFDLLTSREVSWLYFEQRASIIRAFTKYTFDMTNVLEFDHFEDTVKAGLPSVTFVDPLFGDLPAGVGSPHDNDDAPPSDLKDGQAFISSVYQTLFESGLNKNAARTMLVIVYDEHGGFYDHVEPPANATSLTGQNSGKLGPRVPALVVSPWTPAGLVLKDTFDHCSIAATILRRFCSPHPPVLSPRVTAALDLRDALPLANPRGGFPNHAPLSGVTAQARTIERRFNAPSAPDAYGSFLGGMLLTVGSAPR